MSLQPAFDCSNNKFLIFLLFYRQIDRTGDFSNVCNQELGGICSHPKDRLIVIAKTIGILDSQLCLSNPTQATDHLRLSEGNIFSFRSAVCRRTRSSSLPVK